MLLGHTIDKHSANEFVQYKLIQNDVVGMGSHDGPFCWTIQKYFDGRPESRIIDGVKNKEAALMIWEDVKAGKQKG